MCACASTPAARLAALPVDVGAGVTNTRVAPSPPRAACTRTIASAPSSSRACHASTARTASGKRRGAHTLRCRVGLLRNHASPSSPSFSSAARSASRKATADQRSGRPADAASDALLPTASDAVRARPSRCVGKTAACTPAEARSAAAAAFSAAFLLPPSAARRLSPRLAAARKSGEWDAPPTCSAGPTLPPSSSSLPFGFASLLARASPPSPSLASASVSVAVARR
mmetsp:Transcript_28695/g.84714  ORF Transcript_28695/g.84714 Transcript_28695/m.84714 type:complete len:227 (-) Transcript_28695:520-1200(-)